MSPVSTGGPAPTALRPASSSEADRQRGSEGGGILALKEIASAAEPWHVTVAPHNYNSTTVGLACTLQVSACNPNFLITEYFVNFEEAGREILASPPFEDNDSHIALPTAPGLGLELDEAALARHPLQGRRPRHIRNYSEE